MNSSRQLEFDFQCLMTVVSTVPYNCTCLLTYLLT